MVAISPEVTHTDNGSKIIEAFIKDICGCQAKWRAKNIVKKLVKEIKTKVGDKKVLLGISWGRFISGSSVIAQSNW